MGSDPNELTAFDDRLFFVADDGVAGREPFSSDGTTAGTARIVDLWPGEPGSRPVQLRSSAGVLYFSANDGIWGHELWRITTPPAVDIGDVAVLEGDAGVKVAAVPVELSHVSNAEVRFSFATRDASATAGEDYLRETGTVVLPPGSLATEIRLSVLGDLEIESDEQLLLSLDSPIGASLPISQTTVTILNDDFELGKCGHPEVVELHDLDVATAWSFRACLRVAITDSVIASGGVLELVAGEEVGLGNGLVIESEGRLVATIDASLTAEP